MFLYNMWWLLLRLEKFRLRNSHKIHLKIPADANVARTKPSYHLFRFHFREFAYYRWYLIPRSFVFIRRLFKYYFSCCSMKAVGISKAGWRLVVVAGRGAAPTFASLAKYLNQTHLTNDLHVSRIFLLNFFHFFLRCFRYAAARYGLLCVKITVSYISSIIYLTTRVFISLLLTL